MIPLLFFRKNIFKRAVI